MQTNFFTSPTDESELIDFIEKKGGYFIFDFWSCKEKSLRVLGKNEINNIKNFREIGILSNDILQPKGNIIEMSELRDERGFTLAEVIEFTRSYSDGSTLYPGRIFINGLNTETEKLYKSISGFIRRNFKKESDWYYGSGTNNYCNENNLSKAPSTHL